MLALRTLKILCVVLPTATVMCLVTATENHLQGNAITAEIFGALTGVFMLASIMVVTSLCLPDQTNANTAGALNHLPRYAADRHTHAYVFLV